jgi:hypothetical protein
MQTARHRYVSTPLSRPHFQERGQPTRNLDIHFALK